MIIVKNKEIFVIKWKLIFGDYNDCYYYMEIGSCKDYWILVCSSCNDGRDYKEISLKCVVLCCLLILESIYIDKCNLILFLVKIINKIFV